MMCVQLRTWSGGAMRRISLRGLHAPCAGAATRIAARLARIQAAIQQFHEIRGGVPDETVVVGVCPFLRDDVCGGGKRSGV